MNNTDATNNSVTSLESYKKNNQIPLTQEEINKQINIAVNTLNKTFTHIVSNGKNYIIRKGTNDNHLPYLEFFTIKEFKDMLTHREQITIGYIAKSGEEKKKPIAEIWLNSGNAKICETGITFYPKLCQFYKKKMNAYFGLTVKPQKNDADIQTYLDHVKNIICSGDLNYFEYIQNWIAHLFQKPEEKPQVAIVLKAGQGTGKGTFVDPIGTIIGSHYSHCTKSEHLTGRFNGHLENKILIFADEFFCGSKQATDKLKGMITEKTDSIERKGIDTIEVPSFSRMIMASNHENIINTEIDERRYFYLEISESQKQNQTYFAKLHNAIQSKGFHEKLLNYYLTRDIKTFNPRLFPKTEALNNQKLDNLQPMHKWYLSKIRNGSFDGSGSWEARIKCESLVQDLEMYLDRNKLSIWGDVGRKLGIFLKSVGIRKEKNSLTDKNNTRKSEYVLPPYQESKQRFIELLGMPEDAI